MEPENLESIARDLCKEFELEIMADEKATDPNPKNLKHLLRAAHPKNGTHLVVQMNGNDRPNSTFYNMFIERHGIRNGQFEVFAYVYCKGEAELHYTSSTPYLAHQTFATIPNEQRPLIKGSPFLVKIIAEWENYRIEAEVNPFRDNAFSVRLPLEGERLKPIARFFCGQFVHAEAIQYDGLLQEKLIISQSILYPNGVIPS